ncbi:MAG: polysaccharide deacetylase family protein [Clostridia bacterium]|nr:polysaccharide deacetylase family protein [Clostridia bacterium]
MKVQFKYYKDAKKRALTMSYDDGREVDNRLVQIFNLHGIRGTFHLNSGFLGTDRCLTHEDVRDRFAHHEISVHTLTHPWCDKISDEELHFEVMEDRKNLEALCGYPVRGMSYPFGVYTTHMIEVLKSLGMKYARTIKSTDSFALPDDFMAWHPTCHHDSPKLFELLEKFKSSRMPLPLFYVWGHSFEFDQKNNWSHIERFCAEAGGLDDVWYATNIEIYDYLTALRALAFTADRTVVYNPTATDVWIAVDDAPVRICAGATVDLTTL